MRPGSQLAATRAQSALDPASRTVNGRETTTIVDCNLAVCWIPKGPLRDLYQPSHVAPLPARSPAIARPLLRIAGAAQPTLRRSPAEQSTRSPKVVVTVTSSRQSARSNSSLDTDIIVDQFEYRREPGPYGQVSQNALAFAHSCLHFRLQPGPLVTTCLSHSCARRCLPAAQPQLRTPCTRAY